MWLNGDLEGWERKKNDFNEYGGHGEQNLDLGIFYNIIG